MPGIIHADQSVADARALAVDVYDEFLPIAEEGQVQLVTEVHVRSAFESPESALNLVEKAQVLGVVLDSARFVC